MFDDMMGMIMKYHSFFFKNKKIDLKINFFLCYVLRLVIYDGLVIGLELQSQYI